MIFSGYLPFPIERHFFLVPANLYCFPVRVHFQVEFQLRAVEYEKISPRIQKIFPYSQPETIPELPMARKKPCQRRVRYPVCLVLRYVVKRRAVAVEYPLDEYERVFKVKGFD